MARNAFVLVAVGVVILFLCFASSADVPHMINYQGKLTTAEGGCLNDTVQMTFSIYPDTLGSPADWSETQTDVVVKEGIFNVLLGAVDTIPQAMFDGNVKYLGVQVGTDSEMSPLKPIVSVAYAYRAGAVDGGAGGGWVDDGTVVRLEDSTDQVGIGTSSPAHKLDVSGQNLIANFGDNPVALRLGGDANAYIGGYATVGGQPSIYLGSNSYYTTSGWQQPDPARNSALLIIQNGNFGFRNGGSGNPLGSEKMVLDSSGNVGIGTTSPVRRMHIVGTSIVLDNNGDNFGLIGASDDLEHNHYLKLTNATGHASAWGLKAGGILVSDSYAYADPGKSDLIVNGNVGIGTPSPAYKLDVNGSIRSTGTIYGNADVWDGHNWGDTYPNADKVDNIHGTQLLRNDQSGTLNGTLTMGGNINLNQNYLNLGGGGFLKWNYESAEVFLNAGPGDGIIFRFNDASNKLRFYHDGSRCRVSSFLGDLYIDAQTNKIIAERINPAVHNAFTLGGNTDRWADGYFVNLHYSGTLYHSHAVESELPLNNSQIEDGDVIEFNPETGSWDKCSSEKTLNLVSVAAKLSTEAMRADPENIEGSEGRPVILGVYHVKVIGQVRKGQILVTSSTPGYAKAVDATVENLPYRIGRPVELKETDGPGMITAYFNIK